MPTNVLIYKFLFTIPLVIVPQDMFLPLLRGKILLKILSGVFCEQSDERAHLVYAPVLHN